MGKCYDCEPNEPHFIKRNQETICEGKDCGYREDKIVQIPKCVDKGQVTPQNPIETTCKNLTKFLLEKNKRYGNSALKPLKVFSKIEPENSICVRTDDKLSRIVNGSELKKNDIVDLTGYLILLCTQKGWTNFEELID